MWRGAKRGECGRAYSAFAITAQGSPASNRDAALNKLGPAPKVPTVVTAATKAAYEMAYKEWEGKSSRIYADYAQQADDAYRQAQLSLAVQGKNIAASAEQRQLRKEVEEYEEAQEAKRQNALHVISRTGISLGQIASAVKLIYAKPNLVAGLGGMLKGVPITEAYELGALLESIRGGVALREMQELKRTSPTGSTGFGPMSIPELNLLLTSLGSLDQLRQPGRLVEVLKGIAKVNFEARKYAEENLAAMDRKGK